MAHRYVNAFTKGNSPNCQRIMLSKRCIRHNRLTTFRPFSISGWISSTTGIMLITISGTVTALTFYLCICFVICRRLKELVDLFPSLRTYYDCHTFATIDCAMTFSVNQVRFLSVDVSLNWRCTAVYCSYSNVQVDMDIHSHGHIHPSQITPYSPYPPLRVKIKKLITIQLNFYSQGYSSL